MGRYCPSTCIALCIFEYSIVCMVVVESMLTVQDLFRKGSMDSLEKKKAIHRTQWRDSKIGA